MQENSQTDKIISIDGIISANLFDLAPDFLTPADRHSSWELVYVNSGVIISENSQRSTEISQGQIVFNRPDTTHSTRCNHKSGSVIFSMTFNCSSPAIELFDGAIFHVPTAAAGILKALIDECGRTYNISVYPLSKKQDAPFGGEQIIKNYLENLLLLLLRENGNDANVCRRIRQNLPEKRKGSLSEEICEYLKAHICDRVTLDMLSEHFHFGKVYLCDVFKKNVGCTIITYHTDLKISEAKRLLRETDATVTEIADILGFESQSYFTRCFKARVGYPPQSFRKMLVTNAATKR